MVMIREIFFMFWKFPSTTAVQVTSNYVTNLTFNSQTDKVNVLVYGIKA